jgi:hypothetical protein
MSIIGKYVFCQTYKRRSWLEQSAYMGSILHVDLSSSAYDVGGPDPMMISTAPISVEEV